MFQSTKILELGSCAFRQPKAKSHCRHLHGYRLQAKFWFVSKELDENNWVVDFGSLSELKTILREQFDHTTCIDYSDPYVEDFKQLAVNGVCDLRLMNGVGIEKFAEWCWFTANKYIAGFTNNRCSCIKVEVFEHDNNSAVYTGSEEAYTPATKAAVTQETSTESEKIQADLEPITEPKPETKDLTKPPFKPKGGEKKKDSGVSITPRKQIGRWVDPDSTWGL